MVQEKTDTTTEAAKDSSATTSASTAKKKKATVSNYDAVQDSNPLVLTVYKFTSRYGARDDAGNRKEYKVAAESLRSAARLVNVKADSVTQTGVESYLE